MLKPSLLELAKEYNENDGILGGGGHFEIGGD
jgi:hypothetical protein